MSKKSKKPKGKIKLAKTVGGVASFTIGQLIKPTSPFGEESAKRVSSPPDNGKENSIKG
ncbi:MAG TPA: hypothetical protein VIM89_09825 [Mucilaginibacter sp.]